MPRKKQLLNKKTTLIKNPFNFSDRAADLNRRQKWMWGGIFIIFTAIIILWGWSLKIGLDSFSWKESKEQSLINNLQKNWQQNFSEKKTETATLNDQEKNLIKNKLANLINQTLSSTAISANNTTTFTKDNR